MKPTYKKLKGNHYSSNELETNFVDAEALYDEIGYDQGKLIQQNAGVINYCSKPIYHCIPNRFIPRIAHKRTGFVMQVRNCCATNFNRH